MPPSHNLDPLGARLIAFLLLVFLASTPAPADTFRPAYLQLTEQGSDTYEVRWKTPAMNEQTVLAIDPVYPPGSSFIRPLTTSFAGDTAVKVGRIRVPGGVEGKVLRFEGLSEARSQVLVRLIRSDGGEDLYKVSAADPQVTIPRQPSPIGVSVRYTQLGIEHILLGFDHLLFVAALFMLVADLRKLFWTITAFTVAHSITLALVTLDVIRVPVPPVEAFIALSIVFVAVEIVRQQRGEGSLASRKPWLVAFAFGLLHGLGFASALAQIGLPRNNVPLALLFFNVGVEIGQVAFVLTLIAISAMARRLVLPPQVRMVRLAGSYAIGGLASFWLIERIAAFA